MRRARCIGHIQGSDDLQEWRRDSFDDLRSADFDRYERSPPPAAPRSKQGGKYDAADSTDQTDKTDATDDLAKMKKKKVNSFA